MIRSIEIWDFDSSIIILNCIRRGIASGSVGWMTQTSQREREERKELEECVFIKEGYLFENNGFEKWKKNAAPKHTHTQHTKTNNHYITNTQKHYNNKRTITILHKSSLFSFYFSFFSIFNNITTTTKLYKSTEHWFFTL